MLVPKVLMKFLTKISMMEPTKICTVVRQRQQFPLKKMKMTLKTLIKQQMKTRLQQCSNSVSQTFLKKKKRVFESLIAS